MKPSPSPTTRTPQAAIHNEPGREFVNWLLPVYVMLITAGYFVFRSDAVMVKGNALSGDRALFASVNTATLTGLQVAVGSPESFLWPGKLAVFAMTALGAILSMVIGGAAIVRIVGLPYSDWRVLRWTVGLVLFGALLGWAALSGGDLTAFEGAFLGLSAIANSGLRFSGLPPITGWQTQLVIAPLLVLGGLGVVVVIELFDWLMGKKDRLSNFSWVVLGMSGALYLLATGLFFWSLMAAGGQWRPSLATASIVAIDARGGGMGYVLANALPRAMQWLMMAVMLIGAASGSAAGGLKINTLYALWRGMKTALRGQAPGRAFGIALAWVAAYVTLIGALMAVLVAVTPQVPADRMLFDLISAVGNVGLSADVLAIVGAPLYVLSLAMFLGRFAPLLILWWVADTARESELPVG